MRLITAYAAAGLFFLVFAVSFATQLDAQIEAERTDRCEAMVRAGIIDACEQP